MNISQFEQLFPAFVRRIAVVGGYSYDFWFDPDTAEKMADDLLFYRNSQTIPTNVAVSVFRVKGDVHPGLITVQVTKMFQKR